MSTITAWGTYYVRGLKIYYKRTAVVLRLRDGPISPIAQTRTCTPCMHCRSCSRAELHTHAPPPYVPNKCSAHHSTSRSVFPASRPASIDATVGASVTLSASRKKQCLINTPTNFALPHHSSWRQAFSCVGHFFTVVWLGSIDEAQRSIRLATVKP